MINKYKIKTYCRDNISKIKNYDKAIADKENMWECHHINELTYTKKELIKMNMYYNRPADEFIFLTKKEHKKIHTEMCVGEKERKQKINESMSGKTTWFKGKTKSDFGEKYKKHFEKTCTDDKKQYHKELCWYINHNYKCRWEE